MINFAAVKLGKRPAVIDPRTLKLANYFLSTLAPPLPAVDYTFGVKRWGMMLNDELGCCTIAAVGHAEQTWTLSRGGMWTPPDDAILQKYEQWCGYVNGDPSTDQGGNELDVLNNWRRYPGLWKHAITAYADPSPLHLAHVCKAIEIFGGVYIGVQLPNTASGRSTWSLIKPGSEDALAGSWGGHAVWVPKYRTDAKTGKIIFTCISWGELIDITQDFWTYVDGDGNPYLDEVHAIISPDFLGFKSKKTPEGFDLGQLLADLPQVKAALEISTSSQNV